VMLRGRGRQTGGVIKTRLCWRSFGGPACRCSWAKAILLLPAPLPQNFERATLTTIAGAALLAFLAALPAASAGGHFCRSGRRDAARRRGARNCQCRGGRRGGLVHCAAATLRLLAYNQASEKASSPPGIRVALRFALLLCYARWNGNMHFSRMTATTHSLNWTVYSGNSC